MSTEDNERDKRVLGAMVKCIERDRSPYLALMGELFYKLSYAQMKGMLSYFAELEIWKVISDKFEEEDKWVECWGNICYYFTGREEISTEPDKKELLQHIKDYVVSDKYKHAAEETLHGETREAFGGLLEGL